MKDFYTLVKKEMKELMTKQMIISLVAMIVLYSMMGRFIGGVREEQETKPITVSVLDLDRTLTSADFIEKMNERENIEMNVIKEKTREEALEKTKQREEKTLLVMPPGFGEKIREQKAAELETYSIIKGMSMTSITGRSVTGIISTLSREMSIDFIQNIAPDRDIADLMYPLRTEEFVVVEGKAAPGNLAMIEGFAVSQSVLIPVILMMAIMYSGIMVVNSMGMEKENKTLETLLTLPVRRTWIVAGKMVGATMIALIMAGAYMIGFTYYMSSLIPETAETAIAAVRELGLMMAPASYLLLGASLFLGILTALSLSMILGLFVQDSRSAQGMIMPIVLLTIFPFFILMFRDVESLPLALKIILYLIPFSHPTIAAKALPFRNYLPVIGGMVYMALFAAVLIYVAVRLFNTDKVLTARLSLRKIRRRV